MCTHPINPMGIHFLCCVHGNECIGTHDVVRNTFIAIVRDVGFHMGWKQLHALLSITFNSFLLTSWHYVYQKWHSHLGQCYHCQPNASEFISSICTTQGFDVFDATQAKERIYCDRHPTNQFILLTIEVFGCLHKQTCVFLHDCVNAI